MPLFYRRSGKDNPTRHWVGDTRFVLEFDCATHSLSGVRPGGFIDPLAPLGPAETPTEGRGDALTWYRQGIEVQFDDGGTVAAIRMVWRGDDGFAPFRGTFRRGDERLAIGPETTEGDLETLLGPPYWRDQDEDEVLLFYELGPVEWQIGLTRAGLLAEWTVCTPPMMADEAQRRAYAVTTPWPPAGAARA